MTRRPCATCPWRASTKRGDYPGGGVNADGPLAQSCVGFVLQVGDTHAGVRRHVYVNAIRGVLFDTDAPLRSLNALICQHGVVVR